MDFNTFNIDEKDFIDEPILMNEVDLFFSEVEILLTTDNVDVLGNNDFGFDVKRLIWSINATESKIKNELIASIEKYCFTNELMKQWEVSIKFMQGEERDIAVIEIIAEPYEGERTKKSFIFN